ncbi:hypothetical protein EIP91_005891 [Steccherinum ochraceum]|uniref:Uncharacterized protein n=1 Tax=Steccherinum ochraceum TaxID=92696 RepID=A0A4R0R9C2_9APHY|nr:hypothetical protein EIP91_005891 [Steccherinum ochraceum]
MAIKPPSPSSYDHSSGRVGGISPTGPSMWDPSYGAGHGALYGDGPASTSSHGYTAGSNGYAAVPTNAGNARPPSNASYPSYAHEQYANQPYSQQGYPSQQPYPPQSHPGFLPPIAASAALVGGAAPPSTLSESSRYSGTGETSFNSRLPLAVANPDASYTPYHDPRDGKDPQLYLRADRGYEVLGGAGASAQAGSSSRPVLQHQDGGAVSSGVTRPQDSAAVAGTSSSSPSAGSSAAAGAAEGASGETALRRRRSTDKNQMSVRNQDDEPAPPPAYEA